MSWACLSSGQNSSPDGRWSPTKNSPSVQRRRRDSKKPIVRSSSFRAPAEDRKAQEERGLLALARAGKAVASHLGDHRSGRWTNPVLERRSPAAKCFRRQRANIGTPTLRWSEAMDLYDRCITRGFPHVIFPTIYNNTSQIVQGPGYVAIRYEMIHDARVIPLDSRPHLPSAIRSYFGDSRGHWEGDTWSSTSPIFLRMLNQPIAVPALLCT